MSFAPPLATEPTAEQRQAYEREYAQLKKWRSQENYAFYLSLGLCCLGLISYGQAAANPSGLWLLLPGVAVVSGMAAVAWLAKTRGRHPAWGLLWMPGIYWLLLMPNNVARRQDELEFFLQGKFGTHSASDRNYVVGLTLWLTASVLLKNYLKDPSPTGPLPKPVVAVGRNSLLILPAGWQVRPSDGENTEFVAVGPTDVTVALKKPVLKSVSQDLRTFAGKVHAEAAQRAGAAKIVSTQPMSLPRHSGYFCEFQTPKDATYLICCWESDDKFWVLEV